MDGAPYVSVKKGMGALSSVYAFNHERAPMSCLQLPKKNRPPPPPLFVQSFDAKVRRGCLLEYSFGLVHMPPRFLVMFTLEVDDHNGCHDSLEEWPVALLNVYYGKSVALVVMILN